MEVRKLVRVHAQLGGHDLLCDWTTAVMLDSIAFLLSTAQQAVMTRALESRCSGPSVPPGAEGRRDDPRGHLPGKGL
jgi:hypothetical protein